jgi:peptide/nickel transport system substrate-binding protein
MYKMFRNKRWALVLTTLLLVFAFLAACQAEPSIVEVTRVITETVEVEGQPVEVTRVITETEEVVVTVEVPTEVEEPEPEPEVVDRNGGWLDTIVIVQEPDSNSAVARLEAGDLDVYADDIAGEAAVQAIASDAIQTRTQYGLFDEIFFNIGTCQDENVLNPFSNQTIRQALNYAIDRSYIAQELYNGLAVPKYTTIAEASADRARFAKEIRELEAEFAYDFDRANETISAEMEALGATLEGGVWTYNGAPVNLIFLIRNEDTRLLIGGYVANQLEDMGFHR